MPCLTGRSRPVTDRRTGYYVAGQDWPAINSGIPLDDLYQALDGITDEAVEAARLSLLCTDALPNRQTED
jgi:hypothetical protein